MKSENLKAVIDSLVGVFDKENNEVMKINQEQFDILFNKLNIYGEEEIPFVLNMQMNNIYRMLAIKLYGKTTFILEKIVSRELERFFDKYFTLIEGHACSHDKTRFVIRQLAKSEQTGENYNLDVYYSGKEEWNKDHSTNKCYWSPVTVKDTDVARCLYMRYVNLIEIPKESKYEKTR